MFNKITRTIWHITNMAEMADDSLNMKDRYFSLWSWWLAWYECTKGHNQAFMWWFLSAVWIDHNLANWSTKVYIASNTHIEELGVIW